MKWMRDRSSADPNADSGMSDPDSGMSGNLRKRGRRVVRVRDMSPRRVHIRSRRLSGRAAGALLVASIIMGSTGACGHQKDEPLSFFGAQSGNVLAPGVVDPGDVLGFPFPMMRNTSNSPVHVLRFRLEVVPQGAQVLRYRVLSAKDTHGVLLGSFPPSSSGRDGYDSYRGYPPPTIAAHSASNLYAVVYIKVSGPLATDATGCQVTYRTGGKTLTQTGQCDFRLSAIHAPG